MPIRMESVPIFLPEPEIAALEAYFAGSGPRVVLGIGDEAEVRVQPLNRTDGRRTFLLTVDERRIVVETMTGLDPADAARRLAHEFAVLELLEPYQVAPAPLMLDMSARELPYAVMARDYVAGQRLGSVDDLLVAIEGLTALHAVPVPPRGPLEAAARPLAPVVDRAAEIVARYTAHGDADPEVGSRLRDLLSELRQRVRADERALAEAPRVIVHGRASLERVVVTQRDVRLIELDAARLDHPSADLCRLLSPVGYALRGQPFDRDAQRAGLDAYLRLLPIRLDPKRVLRLFHLRLPYVMLQEIRDAIVVWLRRRGDDREHEPVDDDRTLVPERCLNPVFLQRHLAGAVSA